MRKLSVVLMILAGCSPSSEEKLLDGIRALEVACNRPLRMEMYAGQWGRSATFHCDELKPGIIGKK